MSRMPKGIPSYLLYFVILIFLLPRLSVAGSPLGNYISHTFDGRVLVVSDGHSALRIIPYLPDIIRVDFLSDSSATFDSTFVVIQDTSIAVPLRLSTTDSTLVLSTSQVMIVCSKNPVRLSFFTSQGTALLSEAQTGGFSASGSSRTETFLMSPQDHFYGTGERSSGLDLRGKAFASYNTQIGGYGSTLATMNVNIPFLASTNGYALYFDNPYAGQFDLGVSDPTVFSYSSAVGELRYFLMAAPTLPGLLELYTWLTGRQPMPPRWSLGFIQSKFGYQSASEATTVVQTLRSRNIPVDAIILDLYWYSNMGDLSWATGSWPAPFQMMKDFRALGFKTIVITEPYVTTTSSNFGPGYGAGFFGKTASNLTYLLPWWWCPSGTCQAALLDITNPEARQWWWNLHPAFIANASVLGGEVAGFWTDLGEPENHPLDMQHMFGSTLKVHNLYNLLWAKTVFEGYAQFRPGQRIFNLTRSGYAGIQRYGVFTWSGDVARSFGGLAVQVPMLLQMGMSGIAFHNSDIGGFTNGFTTDELYTRWMQFGTFCPITRAHGMGQPTEPYSYSSTTEDICRHFLQVRYRLLPYIYTAARETYVSGMPIVRPLFFLDPNDPALIDESSSFLFGSSILVSPVVQSGQTTKSVYLPKGDWIDYWSDQLVHGGHTVSAKAPLDRMPLFVKVGSIIPMQPLMNYSDERPVDTLTLAIYPSNSRTDYELYEDDGTTTHYQSGEFATTAVTEQSIVNGLTPQVMVLISASSGSFTGKLESRTYRIELHQAFSAPMTVSQNGIPLIERFSGDSLLLGFDGYTYDSLANRLTIQFSGSTDSAYTILADRVLTTSVTTHFSSPMSF